MGSTGKRPALPDRLMALPQRMHVVARLRRGARGHVDPGFIAHRPDPTLASGFGDAVAASGDTLLIGAPGI